MKAVQIDPQTPAMQRFVRLTDLIYAGDPLYIAPAHRAELALLADPDYVDRQALFLVERDGRESGRCAARLGPDSSTGTIGFFECVNDVDACRLLLGAAQRWLASQGAARVLGPMDGDTWHRYRFSLGPQQVPPFLKEPYNPPYYPVLWQACGYAEIDRYRSATMTDPAGSFENLAPFLRRVQRRGYTFRTIRRDRWDAELRILHRLSLEIFADNRHYTPVSESAFVRLYDGIQPLLVPALCQFCCTPEGREIGFVFCYPDYADAVRTMRGRSGWLASLKFLLRRRTARVCIKSLGCLPKYRGVGAGPALVALALEQIVALGYREALMCLMHDQNDSRRLDGGSSLLFREYVLYEKALVPHAS